MNRLTEFAVSQAQRHAAARRRTLHRRHLGLGQPQAGAPAGHRVPGHHHHRAVSRRRLGRRRRAGREADRARHRRRAAARDGPVDLGELDRAGRRPVRVRDRRQGGGGRRSRRTSRRPGLPGSVDRRSSALNINASPVIIASIAATSEDGLEAVAEIARTEIVPEILASTASPAPTSPVVSSSSSSITLDPAKLAESGVSVAQIVGCAAGQQPDVPVRSALQRRDPDPRLDDRDAHLVPSRSRTSWSASAA